jgi:hypothetical protein
LELTARALKVHFCVGPGGVLLEVRTQALVAS